VKENDPKLLQAAKSTSCAHELNSIRGKRRASPPITAIKEIPVLRDTQIARLELPHWNEWRRNRMN